MNICHILYYTNIKWYGTNSIYLLSRLYAILYCSSQRKQHIYGNLASWMMVQAPPTTASLFWFYHSSGNSKSIVRVLYSINGKLRKSGSFCTSGKKT